jgi:catechol 2,3-dioxygenase-like lactoylglutathione lyase family enzyme
VSAATEATHDFRVAMMFHPSHHVTDLRETEEWFARVFGRPSTPIESILRDSARPGYPVDYSTFTPISDVLMDSVDPKRYVVNGVQHYRTVDRPHLKNLGWYVDGMPELFQALKAHGLGVADQFEQLADDEPPMPTFFSVPSETGFRHQFFMNGVFTIDPRQAPDWVIGPVSQDDPLGIECCSHHTILTGDPARQLRLVVDVLGGTVIHETRDDPRGTESVYVHLAGSTLELGVPEPGTAAHEDWAVDENEDTYHAITWKVVDLERAERHLQAQGVRIQVRSEDTIITDPASSLGIPWGFTTTLTPGDPRA